MPFTCKPFNQLSPMELYEIMALRQEVFIVEQNCPYLDADGKDPASWHLLDRNADGFLNGYCRLVPEGVSYPGYTSIGRVVTSPSARRKGYGKLLIQEAIRRARELFGNQPIKISAQSYLLDFYQSFGFVPVGEEYLEDDIPHTAMILKAL